MIKKKPLISQRLIFELLLFLLQKISHFAMQLLLLKLRCSCFYLGRRSLSIDYRFCENHMVWYFCCSVKFIQRNIKPSEGVFPIFASMTVNNYPF